MRTKSTTGKKTKKKGPDLGPSETEVAPEQNTYEMHISEYRKLRCSNPYRWPKRTYTGGDKMFWTNTQYAFWADFYNEPARLRSGLYVNPKVLNIHHFNLHTSTDFC